MNIEKLITLQAKLKAPKDKPNTFGGYKYRSCESILEALKPLLKETNTALVLGDEMVEIGGRIYVKATATLTDAETGAEIARSTAYAREAETKKGMDEAQVTGAASSYARKYALNGLFAIDDTKDADTDEYQIEQKNRAKKPEPTKYVCDICGKEMDKPHHDWSVGKYGIALCSQECYETAVKTGKVVQGVKQ